jgi:hypothetical protein
VDPLPRGERSAVSGWPQRQAGHPAALSTFGWAVRIYGVTSPILTREVGVRGRYGLETVEELVAGPSGIWTQGVKWLDPAGYRRWRDVGLRGFGLDGLEDPRWRGRNEQRDRAFADGLRRPLGLLAVSRVALVCS